MKQMPYDYGYGEDHIVTLEAIEDAAHKYFPDDARAVDWMLEWADLELDLTRFTPRGAARAAVKAYRDAGFGVR